MENRQQTAVRWFFEHLMPFIEFSDVEKREDVRNVLEQAIAMEKEQHKETFKQSRQAKIFEKDMPPVWESFQQYYTETYTETYGK